MLNKDLYDCLIKLGINDQKAQKASEENAKIDIMRQDIAAIRQGIFELTRQAASTNDRVIVLESDVRILKEDVNSLKVHVSDLKEDVGGLKGDVKEIKGSVHNMEEMLKILINRQQ
ncbi:hypothetical protein [Endozoicomonas sp. Mp262]|uniref:hypothetical protein n=1 Tax=Endozoicomonas sp. Mp262 TaxID=2919499 RepID=UPI0021DFA29D